jgi:DTW domain-containing protein YfiP
MCLLMADIEPLKPSNTGWLVADLVAATFAFGWARTTVEPDLLTLLKDPQWQPYLVFPGEFVAPERVVHAVTPPPNAPNPPNALNTSNASNAPYACNPSNASDPLRPTQAPRPLFILLDGTWDEARKMFRKSPYLNHLPVLSLQPEQTSRYRLRRAQRSNHLCTAEVAAVCLHLANEPEAAQALNAYLDLYIQRYTMAKHQQAVDTEDPSSKL